MNSVIRDNIHWVGYTDWTIRDFHGYKTGNGSTYNSYLVKDKKTALIDTVKAPYVDTLIANISALIDPTEISYVVCNHAEPDHSGGLPAVMRACKNAELVCNAKCEKTLGLYYNTSAWKIKVISDGETLSLGERSLTFVDTPMVHWPESMFSYVAEEKLLFSMDAFGQHYASAHRFDDEEPLDVIMSEAKTYYANIVMLYGKPIARTLAEAANLPIEIIAPSHGVIWRKHLDTILAAYENWVTCKPEPKVVLVYDTMYKSTEIMAKAILDGALTLDVRAKLINVHASHITEVATQMLDAGAAAFGSPTLNGTLMPQMAAALTYLKGLRPANKAGFAFGSYGWAQAGTKDIDEYLKAMKFKILREPICSQFVPTAETLAECREAGILLAKTAMAAAQK